jgi:N-acetylglucosaminyldiphosphoundecaprenol N-acetyl-beta-D-mannosaminyltransferase
MCNFRQRINKNSHGIVVPVNLSNKSLIMEKINVLGVGINAIDMENVKKQIGEFIARGGYHYVLATNVHTVMMSQTDIEYRKINNEARLSLADGKPLVWAVRLLAKKRIARICGRDLMTSLCQESLRYGYSHFFYGGREEVLEMLIGNLKKKYRGLKIAGYYSPPFRRLTREEDSRIVEMINRSNADLIWIGLGAPKQERWIADHLGKIRSPVMFAVGAAFDFHAGNIRPAPSWMQKAGLEWFFRLLLEPRRLLGRYLLNNPRFVYSILCQVLKIRTYKI